MNMGWILILMLFGFIAVGMPITFSLGLSSLCFFFLNGIPFTTFAQRVAISVDSFPLLALPFFILCGNIMNNGGVTRRIFNFAESFLESVKGGLSYVCILSSAMFSAISGSSLANAAGLGTIQIQALKERGYNTDFSACLTASAAILGPIIPPSVIMIVFSITAGVSVQRMFMGGVIPGLILCAFYVFLCIAYGKKYGFPAAAGTFHWKRVWETFKDAIWALLTPLVILGGVFSGIFTATESGAIACAYAFIIGVFVYKDLKVKDIFKIVLDTGKTTGSILFITATAAVFGFCLTYARVPQQLAAWLVETINNKYILLLIFMVVYLFLGCIMESSAIVMTTVPIFLPLTNALHIDPVYFGVFVGILMSVGTITPPVGTAMFVICKNTGLSIGEFSKAMIPWFAAIFLFLLLLIFFPQLVTWLPTLIFG